MLTNARAAAAAALASGVVWLIGAPLVGTSATAAAPTFNHDVAPILYARCVSCHRPNEAAPMSLLTYQDARPYTRAIKAKVAEREMPPWPADPPYGRFRNENRLTDDQIATLTAWADAGAPEGTGAPPKPPRLVDGWTGQMDRPPDQIIEAPLAFDLPPAGQVPVVSVWSKQPIGRERVIEAIELRPTNHGAIHHASVFAAKLPAGAHVGRGELWPGGPIAEGVPILRDGTPSPVSPDRQSFGTPLIFYVPSGGFIRFPSGVAKRIGEDDYLLWMFHLTTSGRRQEAGARLGLWFSRGEPEREVKTMMATEKVSVDGREVPRDVGGPIIPDIPAGEPRFTVTGVMTVKEPVTLYALWPHMHSRGHDMTFVLRDPKGREQTLLSVPRYLFEWQFSYQLARPMDIPSGSTITATAHYDNSAANPQNPDSTQPVAWGPQATDEMFNPFLEIAFDRRLKETPFIDFPHP